MGERQTLLQDARLVAVKSLVTVRVRELAAVVSDGAFDDFFDATMRASFVGTLRSIGAHEGTVWLLDESRSELIPRFNNGSRAEEFVGKHRQQLRDSMIGMVVSTEQPICENDVYKNDRHNKGLDRKLNLLTCAMLAVPFYFAGDLRGVLTAVQLKPATGDAPEPPGFSPAHLEALILSASVLARLIEQELFTTALGLESCA